MSGKETRGVSEVFELARRGSIVIARTDQRMVEKKRKGLLKFIMAKIYV